MLPSYRIKRRYVLVEGKNLEEKIKERYIYFFGVFDFLKANIRIIKENGKYVLFSVNRKNLHKFIFVLYTLRKNVIKIFKTLKEYKKYFLNIDRVK